ncbi:putative Ig domain-containing protein [Actinosynnema sp. NPDC047251]|uniref:Serine protease n=1 Tax=Saccharothrix espanaensis (strain ATCC 51144 / DSM 44229 / JCM 9112 / NBRC 15066 / NRRL 15764) TaxID=1179773 RepID=K0JV91_SACES|nr:putative Ig domain-containing protein [Saccharothrix espanaensis]CCH31785.1 Serine protease [Saccharothrix espanaensis DSM 44229]
MRKKSLSLLTVALVLSAGNVALSAPAAAAAPAGPGAVLEVKLAAGVGVAAVGQVLDEREIASVRPLFSRLDEKLAALRPVGAKAAQAPGLERWQRVRLAPGVDAKAAARELTASGRVEVAYPQPEGSDPVTPNFAGQQVYADPVTSGGIDADYAHTKPGGKGGNVKVVDLERNWNSQHEDLSKLRLPGALIANGTPDFTPTSIDHGTAVTGVIGADANTFGVTGLVPEAGLHYTNVVSQENGYDLANALLTAGAGVGVGDVLLIEQHVTYCADWAPMEVWDSVYDAIVTVVQSGRHVVEAGGNGNQDLNNACFGPRFPADKPDSGAIIVGAGAAPGCTGTPRSKLGFSNYGTRVDLQGWGECVTTTGYGDLHGTGANDKYTAYFSGTSSASPVVASALASLLSVAEANGETLSPAEAREILIATGTAQSGTQHIGPLPNLLTAVGNYLANVNFPERVAYPGPRQATRTVPTSLALQAWDGDDDPLTFWATGLPPGLTLAPATGVISGTPTTAGTYTVTVYASDSYTGPAQTTFTWTVS